MELRGAAKVLFHSLQHVPTTTLTQPSRRVPISQFVTRSSRSSVQSSRYFSSTRRSLQQSAAAKKEEDVNDTPAVQLQEPEQRFTLASRHQREARPSIGKPRDRLGSLSSARNASDGGAPQRQTLSASTAQSIPTFGNPSDAFLAQNANNPGLDYLRKGKQAFPSWQSSASSGTNRGESLAELLANLPNSDSGNKPLNRNSKVNTDKMMTPNRPAGYNVFAGGAVPIRKEQDATVAPSFRISPSLGRTVEVDASRNMDVARAFRMVEMKCASNSVKQDLNMQRYHERPGTRRKRLVMSRWRRRFKEAFKATVRRVEDMRRKGW